MVQRFVECLPFDEAVRIKAVARPFRTAARRALTRGRWRPLRFLDERGEGAEVGRSATQYLQWSRHDAYSLMLPSLHKPALSSWSNGDRTMRCACRSLQNVTNDDKLAILHLLYRSRVFFLQLMLCLCARARQSQTRDAALRARGRLAAVSYLRCHHRCFAAAKTRDLPQVRSKARRPRQQTAAPLPADLFTAVIPPCIRASHCAHSCRRCCKRSSPRGHRLPGP